MASEELEAYLIQNPADIHAQGMLAVCCLNLRDFKQAKEIINHCISAQPWNAFYKFLEANYFAMKGEIQPGLKSITEAIELDSYNADYFDLMARLHLAAYKYPDAEKAARSSLQIDSQNQDALNSLSKALIGQNRNEEAANVMNEALAANPQNWETHANYGYRALEQGKTKVAIEHFQNALMNDPNKTFAQHGMKLAMKAKFPLYRWLLQLQFWMLKKGKNFTVGMTIGIIVALNIFQRLQENASGFFKILLITIMAILLLFVYSSWILDPIMNVVLFTHKKGRLALNEEETLIAKFAGASLFVGIIGGILTLISGNLVFLTLVGIAIVGLVCVTALWDKEEPKRQRTAWIFYAISSLCFLIGLFFSFTSEDIQSGAITIGVLTAVLYTWVGNRTFS